ncbi:MAG TPA: hypothetical protein VF367_06120 [Candidatus Limnocylindria bacterium]|jgi:hypothetical protein
MTVQMQTTAVLRQLAMDREAMLRRTTLLVGRERSSRTIRRWIGRRLVRAGVWLAAEPSLMSPARAR